LLPESKMQLDVVKKKMFSVREDLRDKAFFTDFFTYFWANYDDKGYSLWTSDYLSNSDNTQLWMTSNLIGGTAKGYAEENGKYLLGVLNIYAKNEDTAPFKINGACIMRGPQALGGLSADNVPIGMGLAAEAYKWSRLDSNNSEHRKKFEELFGGKTFGNEQVVDRKYYK